MTIGEAVAGPTHAHRHRHLHEKKDTVDWAALDWDGMGIDWASAYAAGQHTSTSAAPVAAPAATSAAPVVVAPAATTAAAPAPTHTNAASGAVEGIFNEVASLFDGLVGVSNGRTTFGGRSAASGALGDNYMGNVGIPYGSNVILSEDPNTYTNKFVNTQSKAITVNVWQKAGPDGRVLSGAALAPTWTTLTFVLGPGEAKTVAFDENTQVGWAESTAKRTASGSFDQTWGEANFVKTGCGYDVTAIENSAGSSYNMVISSDEAPACTSTPTENMWMSATDPVGASDGSCFIFQGQATLKTVMGGPI